MVYMEKFQTKWAFVIKYHGTTFSNSDVEESHRKIAAKKL